MYKAVTRRPLIHRNGHLHGRMNVAADGKFPGLVEWHVDGFTRGLDAHVLGVVIIISGLDQDVVLDVVLVEEFNFRSSRNGDVGFRKGLTCLNNAFIGGKAQGGSACGKSGGNKSV